MAKMVPEGGQQSAPHTACGSTASFQGGASPPPDRCVARGLRSARAFTPPRAETRARGSHPRHRWGMYHARALGGPQADGATSRTGTRGLLQGVPPGVPGQKGRGLSHLSCSRGRLGSSTVLAALTHTSLRTWPPLPFRPALDGPEQPSQLGVPGLEHGPGRPWALPFPPEKSATVSKVRPGLADPEPGARRAGSALSGMSGIPGDMWSALASLRSSLGSEASCRGPRYTGLFDPRAPPPPPQPPVG